MVLDYSKFDTVGDDDEEFKEQIKKSDEYKRPENSMETNYTRGILNDKLLIDVTSEMHEKDDRDEKIKLKDDELHNLLMFVTIQQYGKNRVEEDNTPRAKPIKDFMATGRAPKVSHLLAFMWAVQKRIEKSGRPADETDPIASLLLGALNTLLAIAKKGSAGELFDELEKRPDGAFATRYRACELGTARFAKYREAVTYAETRWYYGDMPPWRDYTPLPAQKCLDDGASAIYTTCSTVWEVVSKMPSWKKNLLLVLLAIASFVLPLGRLRYYGLPDEARRPLDIPADVDVAGASLADQDGPWYPMYPPPHDEF